MARAFAIVAAVAMLAASAVAQTCSCNKLSVDYTSDAIPEATTLAYSRIWLDTSDWSVYFGVYNVESITNGHVIAAPVNQRESTGVAFTPLVSSFDQNNLWNPPECTLGAIDTPAASLGMTTAWEASNCTKSYVVRYSLVDTNEQNQHCTLYDDEQGEIKVNCSITMSTVRAYAPDELDAFTVQETAFTGEITLNSQLNEEVENLLKIALSKCSSLQRPFFRIRCRILGVFDLENFNIDQSPAWLSQNSCTSYVRGGNTWVDCDMMQNPSVQDGEEAFANLTVGVAGTGETMTFNVSTIFQRPYTRRVAVSQRLIRFIRNLYFLFDTLWYGTADTAQLRIDVVDSARLAITQLDMFNSETPRRNYNLRGDPRFRTRERASLERFEIDFMPAAIREDSRFYRFGPQGINTTFRFSAARRADGTAEEEEGWAMIEGMNVKIDEEDNTAMSSKKSTTPVVVGATLVALAVVAVGVVSAVAMRVARRRSESTAAEVKTEQAVAM